MLLLAQDGTLLVYQLWLSELRGVIPTLPPSLTPSLGPAAKALFGTRVTVGAMAVDPSGLYVGVVCAFPDMGVEVASYRATTVAYGATPHHLPGMSRWRRSACNGLRRSAVVAVQAWTHRPLLTPLWGLDLL